MEAHFDELTLILFLYNKLYVEDMSRKIFKVKTNHLRHDPSISFRAFGVTFPIVKNNCLQLVITFLIKKYLLDNYNHLRYKKK